MSAQTTSDELISNKYQKKTDKQHVLDNPDTYIGSIDMVDSHQWIYDAAENKISQKNILYIPALFKLFDEVIVNCRDHAIRTAQNIENNVPDSLPVTYIDVEICNDGTVIMTNDGNGIDIVKHPEYDIWVPELIVGHLRTSTNYNTTEEKIVGGKNGYGIKVVNIWSTFVSIETIDHVRGLKYIQEFTNNLDIIGKPKITKSKSKPYTTITFKPDFKRFGITNFGPDMVALLKKRVYDIASITDKKIKVRYNKELVPIKNFQQYIDLYIGPKDKTERVYEENPRWEFAVGLSPNHEFMQVSFVNGINTYKGGKHVDYILGQITRKMVAYIEKKKHIVVNSNSIKELLILFLRCDIVNPSFDSQSKDFMNTPSAKFGSSCTVSDKFIEKLAKMGIMDSACAITEVKENKMAIKKTEHSKIKNIRGIPKLIDANLAGTERSSECTIIFCEGDSAKAGIVSGLSSEARNNWGVYPMKGKLFNTRGETQKRILENKEIFEIVKFMSLTMGKEYKTRADVAKHLRYGRIMIMCDQDLDGSHIKGLIINLLHSEWPSLLNIPGFICFMNTPILKAKKGKQELEFYNAQEYNKWKELSQPVGWTEKYYKGLGTSTGKEFREYFDKPKIVGFVHNGKPSDDSIDLAFNKKRADERKTWLTEYSKDSFMDTSLTTVLYEDFMNKELILFSLKDCERNLPNLMDGLKVSQRKTLFAAKKRRLTSEIKVAQFTGYVSEHSGYHHGEASLNGTIVGMAQNFVGSNNINLFSPNGQFGTRLQGGKDSASERYIFTQLSKITQFIFTEPDDKIVHYLHDDGMQVEPSYYVPVIPFLLVNGSKGIGTGYSTDIMSYNPLQLVEYIKQKLQPDAKYIPIDFKPYYEGFNGTIEKLTDSKFLIKGIYDKIGPDTIRITELPVGFWTDSFKEYLETLTELVDKNGKKVQPIVKDYDDMCKDTTINFIITLTKGKLDELEAQLCDYGCNGVEKQFKLYTTNTTTNMHVFNSEDKLVKYDNVSSIIEDYYSVRLEMYKERKLFIIDSLLKELVLLTNKSKYIKENLEGTIDLRRKKKDEILQMLISKNYDIINEDADYKYLIKLPMDSVTEENVTRLEKEHGEKVAELEKIQSTSIQQMWMEELDVFVGEYLKFKEERERNMLGETKPKKIVKIVKKKLLIEK